MKIETQYDPGDKVMIYSGREGIIVEITVDGAGGVLYKVHHEINTGFYGFELRKIGTFTDDIDKAQAPMNAPQNGVE